MPSSRSFAGADGTPAGGVLTPQVHAALTALVPGRALTEEHTGGPGQPGGFPGFGWNYVTKVTAWHRLGFAPPALTSLAAEEEVTERFLAPTGVGVPSGLPLSVYYLPTHLQWERADVWPALCAGASSLFLGEDYPWHWPAPVPASERDGGGRDYAVVQVAGVHVGVQADISGVVRLAWVLRRGDWVSHASAYTRRSPREAIELLIRNRVLT
ncbi:hypothetical protein [Kineococcus glutinatus]|uniref:hypothetical protein n=1 Tax=Kineococcus glutinatus TaxID=1070872 RepID=UPI0031F0ABCC